MARWVPVLLVLLTLTRPLMSQVPGVPAPVEREGVPALVKWGKWGAAALFAGFTVTGVSRHNAADDDFRRLLDWCRGGGGSCELAPGGAYADPASEGLYQSVIAGDRSARRWLVAGQVALAGAVALFIVDLTYTKGPQNIPFDPRLVVTPGVGGTNIGVRLRLPR